MVRGITAEIAREIREANGLHETRLQKMRYKRNMTQGELAQKSGVTIRAIQNYEQQNRPIEGARLDTLCNLSEALGCKIEDILEDKDMISKYKRVK